MNKKLIAAALAALPVVSIADVTVYGTLNGGLQRDSTTNRASENRVDDLLSWIGFKGNEDLGNGLKAVWQVENRLNIDGSQPKDEPNSFGSRQTFIGLEGAFGTFRLGRLNNALQDLVKVDPWTYSFDQRFAEPIRQTIDKDGNPSVSFTHSGGANGLGVYSRSADRLKNAIRYDSPDLAGFTGHVEYGFGENKSNNRLTTGKNSRSSDIVSLGLNYTNSGFFGNYAYQKEYNPSSQPNDNRHSADIQRLELGYDANNLLVALGFQRARGYDWSDDFSGDGGYSGWSAYSAQKPIALEDMVVNGRALTAAASPYMTTSAQRQVQSKQAALTIAYTMDALTPRISYAKGWNQKDNINGKLADTGYRQWVVGADYALSKRTSTGVSYGDLKWDKNATQALQSIEKVGTTGNNFETKDISVRTFGVHLTHSF